MCSFTNNDYTVGFEVPQEANLIDSIDYICQYIQDNFGKKYRIVSWDEKKGELYTSLPHYKYMAKWDDWEGLDEETIMDDRWGWYRIGSYVDFAEISRQFHLQ